MCIQSLHTNVYSTFIYNCKTISNKDILQQVKKMNKLWYITITESYLVIKRNKLRKLKNT